MKKFAQDQYNWTDLSRKDLDFWLDQKEYLLHELEELLLSDQVAELELKSLTDAIKQANKAIEAIKDGTYVQPQLSMLLLGKE